MEIDTDELAALVERIAKLEHYMVTVLKPYIQQLQGVSLQVQELHGRVRDVERDIARLRH